jgi:hypothetical protein
MSVNDWGVDVDKIRLGDTVRFGAISGQVLSIGKAMGGGNLYFNVEVHNCVTHQVYQSKIRSHIRKEEIDAKDTSSALAPLRNQVLSTTGCKVNDEAISLIIMWYEKQKVVLEDYSEGVLK